MILLIGNQLNFWFIIDHFHFGQASDVFRIILYDLVMKEVLLMVAWIIVFISTSNVYSYHKIKLNY